jgi:hypothetical protein
MGSKSSRLNGIRLKKNYYKRSNNLKIKIGLLTLIMCGRLFGMDTEPSLEGIFTNVDFVDGLFIADELYLATANYVNGGVTVDLSGAGFTAIPTVLVSIQPASYDGSTIYNAQISYLDENSAIIFVLKIVDGVVTEAATDDVTLQVWIAGVQVSSI